MKIKKIITLSMFSLLLVLTSCSTSNVSKRTSNVSSRASNQVVVKDYKNEVDYSEYMRLYKEINNNFLSGKYDFVVEGNASKIDESEDKISSMNTRKYMHMTKLDFNLSFDKDSKVYNYNLKSNLDRDITTNSSNNTATYNFNYDYTHQIDSKNFYSLNNASNNGLITAIDSNLDSNSFLVRKLLSDVEGITRNISSSFENVVAYGQKKYYVDGNVFTIVTTINDIDQKCELIQQETCNAENREIITKASLTTNFYDASHNLITKIKKSYDFNANLTIKDVNLQAKDVNTYSIVLV